MNKANQETVLLTGASGFIGRNLIDILQDHYRIIAVARRAQKEAGVCDHPNLNWQLVDITNQEELAQLFQETIPPENPIDFVVHLAAYYDFGDQVHNDLYEQTNVVATHRILEHCKGRSVKRFLFASSLVASEFPAPGDLVYEKSKLNAVFPYALTKQKGEEFCREYAEFFPCTILRMAAVFSDWCEYEPLYHFLNTWLSGNWKARILAGHQGMAIPYIHISCVTEIMGIILGKTARMKQFDILLISPNQPTSLLELFRISTRLSLGQQLEPIRVPAWFARLGILMMDLMGRLRGQRPFERLWMADYIDQEFHTDCTYTRKMTGWHPKERRRIEHRLLHMVANMKSVPEEWHHRNLARARRFLTTRPTLTLAQELHFLTDELVTEIQTFLVAPENQVLFPYYHQLEPERLRFYIDRLYGNLCTSVRHGDRSVMIRFAHDLAKVRHQEGVDREELLAALKASCDIITHRLYSDPRLAGMKLLVHDHIALAIQLAMDETEETYDQLIIRDNGLEKASCLTNEVPDVGASSR